MSDRCEDCWCYFVGKGYYGWACQDTDCHCHAIGGINELTFDPNEYEEEL